MNRDVVKLFVYSRQKLMLALKLPSHVAYGLKQNSQGTNVNRKLFK